MNLDAIFCPKSIALVGASRQEASVGHSILKNLTTGTYKGHVWAVNPKATEIFGQPCYPRLTDIPDAVDLAIIAVPAAIVPTVLEDAAKKNVQGVVVISAGFKEAGEKGEERERDLKKMVAEYDMTLIGPNCLGILNAHLGLNASFETVLPIPGSIAFVSQSGALISSLLDIANERSIGFSKVVSVGNKTRIGEHELLPYLYQDPQTSVILVYAESMENAPALITTIEGNLHSQSPKPIILLKAGASESGKKASSSHTGSLAGSDAAYEALVRQAGIIRVSTVGEMLTTANIFATNPAPKGQRLAIVTNAGGPGIIATDQSEREGLVLSILKEETKLTLKSILPEASHVSNPIDVLGDATHERYEQTMQAVAADEGVDMMLTIVTPQSMTDIPQTAGAVITVRDTCKKPIVASFMGASHVNPGVSLLQRSGVSHAQFPEDAITALGHLSLWAHYLSRPSHENIPKKPLPQEKKDIITHAHANGGTLVDTQTIFDLLAAVSIPVVAHALVQSEEHAREKARTIAKTLALKVVSPDISHKTDVGGVLLNIAPENAQAAFGTIMKNIATHVPQARTHGILLTEMITQPGIELILGIKKEPGLGTLIMLGAGGIYVELLKDVTFRFAPLDRRDCEEMITELKIAPVLSGFRGSPEKDKETLIQVLLSLSSLAQDAPEILELDINPFLLFEKGKGGVSLDARIVLG